MSRRHYHLLCALPGLRDLESAPPLKKQGFLSMVRECRGPEAAVRVLLLEDDLIQREAVLCNEMDIQETDMAVLSPSQATGDQPLPAFLRPTGPEDQEMSPHTLAVDLIWRRYFFHAAERAQRLGSHYLARWVAYEVGLKNALARARAQALELEAQPYLVAEELEDPRLDFDREIDEWKRAPHLLAGLEALETIRWQRFAQQEPWYDFGDDEVVAYGAKLMILLRRHRIFEDSI